MLSGGQDGITWRLGELDQQSNTGIKPRVNSLRKRLLNAMQALCSADYQDTKRGDPSNAVIVQRGCRSRVGKTSGQVRPAAIEAGNRPIDGVP